MADRLASTARRYLALALAAGPGCATSEPTPTPAPTVASIAATRDVRPPPAETTAPPAATGNTQPSSTPPYDAAAMPAPTSHVSGMCGRTTCEPERTTEPLAPAPAPFQRCDTKQVGAPPPGDRGFSAFHTAQARNAGDGHACCYLTWATCGGKMGGRAYRPEGAASPVVAASRGGDGGGWSGEVALELEASPELSAQLAAAWRADASFEHASIASFNALALALLANGAPPSLIQATALAALDEVEHARLAYGLAAAYGGAPVGPGALAVAPGAVDVASLVRFAILDGCVGESVATQLAIELAARTEEPAVRAFHARTARDEDAHAALAFSIVAWAVRALGAPARAEVDAALDELRAHAAPRDAPEDPELQRWGRADGATRAAVEHATITRVVVPVLERLRA